jgi:uncharacterized protein
MTAMPRPTRLALLATLAATSTALAAFVAGAPLPSAAYLLLFTGLFALRVAGQIGVRLLRPSWLPPMAEWNFVPYRILLPAQLAILVVMAVLVLDVVRPGNAVARGVIGCAVAYWAAMALRYAVRMTRRPDQRWLGGTIPIVFHCVLAGFLFVLGASHAS